MGLTGHGLFIMKDYHLTLSNNNKTNIQYPAISRVFLLSFAMAHSVWESIRPELDFM